MAGLLSGVSGLDGSLFTRPSSMNDMRTRGQQQSPVNAKVPTRLAGSGSTGPQVSPTLATPPNSYPERAQVRSMPQYPAQTTPFPELGGAVGSGTSTEDPFSLNALTRDGASSSKGCGICALFCAL